MRILTQSVFPTHPVAVVFHCPVIRKLILYLCVYKYNHYSIMEQLLQQYIASFTPKEMQAYLIAKSHLGSSFSLYKSVGFLQWKKKQGL